LSDSKTKRLAVLLQLVQYVKPYRLRLAVAVAALIFTAAVTLSIGQGVRLMIDQGFVAQSGDQLLQAIGIVAILAVLMSIGSYIRFYQVSWLGERVSADLRRAVFNHIITLQPSYFEANPSGEIMSRLTADTTILQSIVGASFSMALRSTITIIGAFIILLVTNWKLTMIMFGSVPLVLLPMLFYGQRVRDLSRKSQDSIADVGTRAGEAIQHIKVVQSYTQEAAEVRTFGDQVERAFGIAKRRIRQRALLMAVAIVAVFMSICAMLWVGGSDVLSGAMTAGELGAYIFYAMMAAMSVAMLSEVFGELQRAAGATERLIELTQVPHEILAPSHVEQHAKRLRPSLTFDEVSFTYPSRPDEPALQHLNLAINEGETLALVGPSGAGKTTLFELIQRFYDPQQGRVLFADTPLTSLDPSELRQQIAVVAQQPALFAQSVAHNIRYGRPEATMEEVIEAAKAAHAHDFIAQLPDAYDSYLGEHGTRLSGGQRQRIAIARAVIKDPRILLLDEATSALDNDSEYHVQQALNEIMQDRTTVIIAHRLSTVINADRIVVLDKGQIVATGTHQQLLQSSELYQRLAAGQFGAD
jgi:ATP-binding cassette subfamily B protein